MSCKFVVFMGIRCSSFLYHMYDIMYHIDSDSIKPTSKPRSHLMVYALPNKPEASCTYRQKITMLLIVSILSTLTNVVLYRVSINCVHIYCQCT